MQHSQGQKIKMRMTSGAGYFHDFGNQAYLCMHLTSLRNFHAFKSCTNYYANCFDCGYSSLMNLFFSKREDYTVCPELHVSAALNNGPQRCIRCVHAGRGCVQIATLLLYSQHVALHLAKEGRTRLHRVVDYTVQLLADTAADFIIQQGGWVSQESCWVCLFFLQVESDVW